MRLRQILFLVSFLVFSNAGCAATTARVAPSDGVEKTSLAKSAALVLPDATSLPAFEEKVQTALKEELAPGLVFVVVDDGRAIFAKGYGYADLAEGAPASPDTIFPVGSISKTFIGAAAAIASAEERFDPAAPVADYLSFTIDAPPETASSISFLHLATHTSGIVDNEPAYETAYAMGEPVHPASLSEYLKSYLTRDGALYDPGANFSAHAPGRHYEYSNIASALAALALSDSLGVAFDAYTDEKIFKPLGMTSTTWFLTDVDMSRAATLYEKTDDGFSPYPVYSLATWPDGGLRTSANDLARYLIAFMNGGRLDGTQVLNENAVDIALGSLDLNEVEGMRPRDVSRGLFWFTARTPASISPRLLVGHNGSDPGVVAIMEYDPIMERGVIAIANADMESREALLSFYALAHELYLTSFD